MYLLIYLGVLHPFLVLFLSYQLNLLECKLKRLFSHHPVPEEMKIKLQEHLIKESKRYPARSIRNDSRIYVNRWFDMSDEEKCIISLKYNPNIEVMKKRLSNIIHLNYRKDYVILCIFTISILLTGIMIAIKEGSLIPGLYHLLVVFVVRTVYQVLASKGIL